jgi:Tol biopolymer transport system component/DNA-binding winged helix-turn-helix (wHTH) protein
MSGNKPTHLVLSFGPFEADLQTQELKKQGMRLRLPGQSFQILAMLLQRPGQLVTREELHQALWPADTFVDFEKGINAAMNRLREVVGDSADSPRYVETLPRRGYRLIVPVSNAHSVEPPIDQLPLSSVATGRKPRFLGLVILGVFIVILGAVTLWKVVLQTPSPVRVLRFTQLTNDGESKSGPMATDGASVYFNEVLPGPRNLIMQVSIRGGEAVPMPVQFKQPVVFDVSKDGTELLVANDEGNGFTLWLQPVTGGSPHRVGMALAHDARFGVDATTVIYGKDHDVYSLNRDGSSPRKLLTADNNVAFAFQYSPDGRRIRFSIFDVQIDSMAVLEAPADGAEFHKLFEGCCGRWTSDGRYFVFQDRHNARLDLWALPEKKHFRWRKSEEKPTQLTAGPLNFEYPLPSKDDKQVFAIGTSHRAEVIRYDSRGGKFLPYLSGVSAEGLAFSRDGQWVTYTSFPDGTLWRSRVDGTERRQLTFSPLRVFSPRWSPDGKQIAFNADLPETTRNVYVISSDSGTPQRILPSEQSQMDVNWSPDGKSLVFGTLFVQNAPIYTFDLQSRSVSTLAGSNGLFSPRWSPDGKYIAAIATDAPRKLMLFDVATQKWTEAVGSQIGSPMWSQDGKYIYFQDWQNQDQRERIARLRLSDRKIEKVVDVKDIGRLATGTFVDWFGLAPDDSPLLARDISTQEIYSLEMQWP